MLSDECVEWHVMRWRVLSVLGVWCIGCAECGMLYKRECWLVR